MAETTTRPAAVGLSVGDPGRAFGFAALALPFLLLTPLMKCADKDLPGTREYQKEEVADDVWCQMALDDARREYGESGYVCRRSVTYQDVNWLLLLAIYGVYFLPCAVAVLKGTDRVPGLFLVNFLLGWTLVVWLWLLVRASIGRYAPVAAATEPRVRGPLVRRQRLGGLLNHYYRKAA